jgi:hypothetical protein
MLPAVGYVWGTPLGRPLGPSQELPSQPVPGNAKRLNGAPATRQPACCGLGQPQRNAKQATQPTQKYNKNISRERWLPL